MRQLESPRGFRPSPFSLTIDIGKSSEIFEEIILTGPGQVYSRGKVDGSDPIWPTSLLQSAPLTAAISSTRARKTAAR